MTTTDGSVAPDKTQQVDEVGIKAVLESLKVVLCFGYGNVSVDVHNHRVKGIDEKVRKLPTKTE